MDEYEIEYHAPLLSIAKAAQLASMHPQTLRQYDRIGLVQPSRTRGNTRRYSLYDVEQLQEIARLSAEGLSLEGVRRVLELKNQVRDLQLRVSRLERVIEEHKTDAQPSVFAAASGGEVVQLAPGTRVRRGEIVLWRQRQL